MFETANQDLSTLCRNFVFSAVLARCSRFAVHGDEAYSSFFRSGIAGL